MLGSDLDSVICEGFVNCSKQMGSRSMLTTFIPSISLQPAVGNQLNITANQGPGSSSPWVSSSASKVILNSKFSAWDYLSVFTTSKFWKKDFEDDSDTIVGRVFDKVVGFFLGKVKDEIGPSEAKKRGGVFILPRGYGTISPNTELRDPYFVYWPPFSQPLPEKYFSRYPCNQITHTGYYFSDGIAYPENRLKLTLSNALNDGCYTLLPSISFDENLGRIFYTAMDYKPFVNRSEVFPVKGAFEASSELVPLKTKLSYDSKYQLTPEFLSQLNEGLQGYTKSQRKIYNYEAALFMVPLVMIGTVAVVGVSSCVVYCYIGSALQLDKEGDLKEVVSHGDYGTFENDKK